MLKVSSFPVWSTILTTTRIFGMRSTKHGRKSGEALECGRLNRKEASRVDWHLVLNASFGGPLLKGIENILCFKSFHSVVPLPKHLEQR